MYTVTNSKTILPPAKVPVVGQFNRIRRLDDIARDEPFEDFHHAPSVKAVKVFSMPAVTA
jgi:hypothetical protein